MSAQTFFEPSACEEMSRAFLEAEKADEKALTAQYLWRGLTEPAVQKLFSHLAERILAEPACQATCFLMGPLGAGKSTAARALIRAMGVTGPVKSPTYALLEPYDITVANARRFCIGHWDLYRLGDPDDIEQLGFRDYLAEPGLQLIEWPEQGAGYLPWPDLAFQLQLPTVTLTEERNVLAFAFSSQGRKWLTGLGASVINKDKGDNTST